MSKRVFFIIPALSGGGAERVMIQLLKYIDRTRFNPHLVLFEHKGRFVRDVPSDVKLYSLDKEKCIFGLRQLFVLIKLARLIRKQKPTVIVSFMWYTNTITLLARMLCGSRCKVIVAEHNTLSLSYEGWFTELARKVAVRFLYPKSDCIIVVAKGIRRELVMHFHIQPGKIVCIYNPIDISSVRQCANEEVEHPWFTGKVPVITSIGSLTLQKGFSYLLKAMAGVLANGSACRLVILGEGPEKASLQNLARDLGVADRVVLLGFQENPYKYLRNSTIFALPSLYEGCPNVLLEALALGVPSIATRCPGGPEEIVTHGVDGILVPPGDVAALADAIKMLLLDTRLRKRLGAAAKKRAEDFSVHKIVRLYEAAIEKPCAASEGN